MQRGLSTKLQDSNKKASETKAFSLIFVKKWLPLSLKFLIFAATLIYLYQQVWRGDLLDEFIDHVLRVKVNAAFIITSFFIIIGIALNWGIEALKWKFLLKNFYKISILKACKAVLAGTAISLWMPNRIGEYLGRVLYVKSQKRIRAVLATMVGSFAQLIVTILMGIIGISYYLLQVAEPIFVWKMLFFITLLTGTLLLFLYFNIQNVKYFVPANNWGLRVKKYTRVFSQYSSADLRLILAFSFVRYMVFSLQFLLMLYLFNVDVSIVYGLMYIFLYYLVQTSLPSTLLTEIGIRGAVSIYFFSDFAESSTQILAASYGLWAINLILPALVGLVFLLFKRLKIK